MSVYLDNAATTKPCDEAVKAVTRCMKEIYGNPSSLHKKGIDAELAVTNARRSLASALCCDPMHLYFTSGATESNNLAIFSAAQALGRRKKKIITSSVEHPSVEEPLKSLEAQGFEVVRIAPRDGIFDAADFIDAADENTALVTVMMVNNETGAVLPVQRIFTAVKRRFPDTVTHCDCVQGFMKLPVRLTSLGADMVTVSAHKVYGPKGAGALYASGKTRIIPITLGGHQEKGIRSGTEAVPAIAGFGAAVKAHQTMLAPYYSIADENRAFLLRGLARLENVSVNSLSGEDSLPYIVNFSVRGVRSEIMLHFLEEREIYVSSGSACSKGAQSSVLRSFGISEQDADCALRVSMSRETTQQELRQLLLALGEGIRKLRR